MNMKKHTFTILMSASIPTQERSAEFRKIPNAQIQIEQAVIALARNVFQAGGRMVFGGHPSISPLVLMVATEYNLDKGIESPDRNQSQAKPIVIYQSNAFKDVISDKTYELFNLGYAEIEWTEAFEDEKCNPSIKGTTQCEKSLTLMREKMMTENPAALVCIGGMEGVVEEFNLFRAKYPYKPVYLFEPTGGASRNLAEEYRNSNNVKIIDKPSYNFTRADSIEDNKQEKQDNEQERIEIIPYTFMTALVVRDLLERNNQ